MKISVRKMFGIILLLLVVLFNCSHVFGEKKQIRFAFHQWPPMCYVDGDGTAKGLYLDLLREVFEKQLGMTMIPQQLPWKRCQTKVRTGEVDFMLTVATDERIEYTIKSDRPFYELYLYVYTYAGHSKSHLIQAIQTADDMKTLNLTTVTNLGNGWHKNNIESAGVKTHYVRQEQNALKFLAKKRADIMIDALVPTNDAIRKLNLVGKITQTEVRFGPILMHLLMSKKSEYTTMMPDINRVFQTLSQQGTIDRIFDRYTRLEE